MTTNPEPSPTQEAMRIVIVGGVAGGMSAAARARRLDEHAEIVVLEQGAYVSFANCGLPYHLSGEIAGRDELLLHTAESLGASLNLDVRTGHRVTGIDRHAQKVTIQAGEDTYALAYDALLLSPGATAVRPPIEGLDHPAVHTLRTVPDVDALRERIDDLLAHHRPREQPPRAVVIGAGFIGLEAVEALTTRGLQVHLVELADHVLPPLDAELAPLLADELAAHGVDLRLSVSAQAITEADARGDSASAPERPAGIVTVTFSAGAANRQGRRAADSICGRRTTPQAAVLGTAIVRVFGLTAATTGANQATLRRAGIEHEVMHIHPADHAGYYPGSEQVHLVASFAPDGTLLGAQGVGRAGVDKRIDILATAIRAGMSADDLAELELAYAPPYGSAKDPVNMLGFVAQNVLDATMPQWQAQDLDEAMATTLILDVRSQSEYAEGHLDGALNIPHLELRQRLDEVTTSADGRTVSVHCASGVRSYLATRVLLSEGFNARNLSGGWLTLKAVHPNL